MAARKKQDEKNLKTLRELGSLSANKYCFDCNQRGPTYVDVTIGSFVCTKCSGLLRGLTPPHRVKSISMATFTQDEINLLESKGNEYCRKVWLGLYEGTPPSDSRDDQAIKDFMSEKYEKKRYYIEPSTAIKNGYHNHKNNINGIDKIEPKNNINNKMPSSEPKPILNNKYNKLQVNGNRKRPEVSSNFIQPQLNNIGVGNGAAGDFVANFETADIFSAANNNMTTNNNLSTTLQQGFANFENNPVFNNGSAITNGVSPSPTLLMNLQNQTQNNIITSNVPSEDRYAALKDLDNALKTQSALDWSSGSNGSLYNSPTPTGSMYSSPSPQSSLFGSPSQGQFLNGFPAPQETNGTSNPFNNNGFSWTNNGKVNGALNGTNGFNNLNNYQNPFKVSEMNGFPQMMQPTGLQMSGDVPWAPNPFKIGAATVMGSNNPFL